MRIQSHDRQISTTIETSPTQTVQLRDELPQMFCVVTLQDFQAWLSGRSGSVSQHESFD
jgi:hypothetical protein